MMMLDAKKITIVALILIVVGAPFIFREKGNGVVPVTGVDTVVVLTAHNEALRREYALGFQEWYKRKTGKDIYVDWRYQGGGRDAARYIESMYSNNYRLFWEQDLRKEWLPKVASYFNTRNESHVTSEDELQRSVVQSFFDSDVTCGMDVYFGGGVYEFISQAARGNLVTCDILQEHPEMFGDDTIPATLSGERLWDDQGRWFGGSLSAFGIIYNIDALKEDGIGIVPQTWMDIGRPEFYKKLAIVDPTKSSSTQKAFVMLIQQQMQMSYDKLLLERGVEQLSEEDEHLAISQGWLNGLQLIQKIVANGRYFTESATRPIVDVSAGNCIVGISVDFYGFAEAKHLEERSGSKRFKFVMPVGGGAPSPDPIGIFRGAPHPELAKLFIEFVLSLDGQKLLDFKVGEEGGPKKTTMRRMPILKTIYQEQYDDCRCDATINPYKSAKDFMSHEEWTNPVFNSIGAVIRLAFLNSSAELSDAMGAIIRAHEQGRHDAADAAYAILSDMPELSYDNIKNGYCAIKKGNELLPSLKHQGVVSEKFRKQYLRAKQIANGE